MLRDEVKGILDDYQFKSYDNLLDELMEYVNEIFIDCHEDMRSILFEHFVDHFEEYDNDAECYIDRYDVAEELRKTIHNNHQQLRSKDQ